MVDKIEITLNSVDKTVIGQINTELENYDKGIIGSNKSVNTLSSVIFHSGMITFNMLEPYDNRMTQADISPFVNACIQQYQALKTQKALIRIKEMA